MHEDNLVQLMEDESPNGWRRPSRYPGFVCCVDVQKTRRNRGTAYALILFMAFPMVPAIPGSAFHPPLPLRTEMISIPDNSNSLRANPLFAAPNPSREGLIFIVPKGIR